MVQTLTKMFTLAEFLQLPETEPPSEYIDGEIIQKPMPQGQHSSIQTEFVSEANSKLRKSKIARVFVELRCTFGGKSIIPDVSVFTWDRIPRQDDGKVANIFTIAPDWVIEILSPNQSQTKITKKILHCLKYGTQVGWLIDPAEETVFVYRPKQDIEVFDQAEDLLIVPEFASELQLTYKDLFAWLLE